MKKHPLLILLLLVALLMQPCAVMAQDSASYVTTLYNERNGLPTGEANVVYQTKDHYIWIGSYGGLIRYDGTSFRNYSQEGAIPSSSIRSLLEDSQGRLWIGTNDAGLFLFENDVFTHIPEAGTPVYLCIRDLIENIDGVIYAASSSGLARVENGLLQGVNDPLVTGQAVYSLGADSHGHIWASLNDWQCAIVTQDSVNALHSDAIFPDGQQIYSVTSDISGNIYLGTYQNAVARVTFPADHFDPSLFQVTIMNTGDVTIHNKLTVSESGDILICGQMGFAWLRADGTLHTFGETENAAALNHAMLDYEGNLWLASSSSGVIKFSQGCFTSPNADAGLDGISFNTIIYQGGRYYLGLDSGLMIFDENWLPIENQLTQMLQGIRIRHILADENGLVWLATYSDKGTLCYDPATEAILPFNQDSGMTDCWTRTLLSRKDGSVIAGTANGFYVIENQQVTRAYGAQDGLKNTVILCLAEDDNGTLYIGTDGGGMYTLQNGVLTHHGINEGLSDGVVLRLLPDDQGGLFVSAGSSLYYWQNGVYQKLDQFEKAAGSIFDFYLKDGKLWLVQNSGILEVNPQQLLRGLPCDTTMYSFQHGLTGSLNANTWHYLSPDGRLYLATRSGISVFSFQGVENQLPSGIIHAVRVDNTVYEHPSSLSLSSDAHRITIDFSALSFTETQQCHISYYLEGLDAAETILTDGKSGNISYTNLAGGDYVFHLKICHPERPGEVHHYQLPIHKDKKLTEKPLFWIALGIALLGILAAAIITISHLRHKAHVRRMQERHRELQAILDQSLQSFARVIDAKDPYTNGHSIRVAQYARELAKRMHMSEDEQDRIYYIALLHDIGKIGIPDHILNKQGPLTPEERAIIQTHPEVGGHVLEGFSALEGIADGARYHHERYDGTGYCDGKKGEEIPLVARIIGVADSYDAMSSDRCYRPALSKEKIISELKDHSGTQFDPQITPFMLAMIEENAVPAKDRPSSDRK